ncbi:MAG: hypothetical protein LLG06_09215 [Desulfobacteraceae bacterium]|nr:hypothetical protein [Desulfobacteraceae bacterium]
MRIILIGQAPFGAKTLESLLNAGENVVAVYAPQDRPGGRPDPLKEAALAKGLPLFQPRSFRDDAVYANFKELKPDLAVLAFVTDIVPNRYFTAATAGAICFHPSILPRHRGASAINWAIIMGDTRTGLSIFWPDAGIDTGPVLLQKEVEIGSDDTAGSLYFERIFPLGVEALTESVRLVREGAAPRIPQGDAGATYEPPCDDRAAAIDWEIPGRKVYDLIRGCDPQPGAYARHRGETVRLYGASFAPGEAGLGYGTVSEVTRGGIRIAVDGGALLIGKVRSGAAGKTDASAWAASCGIREGDRFE